MLVSPWYYIFFFSKFCWNLPDRKLANQNIVRSIITYLGKCLPIDRAGDKKHHEKILGKVLYVLKDFKEPVLIFPEGGRNRSMLIRPHEARYGVGKIIQSFHECRVLVIYMRESHQLTFSDYPKRNGTFHLLMKEFHPNVKQAGLAEQKSLTLEVMKHLQNLEKEYFQMNPKLEKSIRVQMR